VGMCFTLENAVRDARASRSDKSSRAITRFIEEHRIAENLTWLIALSDDVVGKGRDILKQGDIRSDLRTLEDSSERVRRFVNKRVAHRAPKGQLRQLPKFNEVDEAMDTIDRLFCKYNLLLTASGMSSAFATRQYNWMEVLYDAWVQPGSKFRPAA
jgi:hypothetical protein